MSVTPYDAVISIGNNECNIYLAFNIGFDLDKKQEVCKVINSSERLTNMDAKFDLSLTWIE